MVNKENPRVTVLGWPVVFTDENNKIFLPRIETKIYLNDSDKYFLSKLEALQIKIISIKKNMARIFLPVHWTHFRRSRVEELIVDPLGRVRMIVDLKSKKTVLLRRFNYGVELMESDKLYMSAASCYLVDSGRAIESTKMTLTSVDIKKIWDKEGLTKDDFMKVCVQKCEETLDNVVPDWKDELAYWDFDIALTS